MTRGAVFMAMSMILQIFSAWVSADAAAEDREVPSRQTSRPLMLP